MRFILPLIALAAVAAPVAAEAAAEQAVTVRIAYGDVDVTTPEGRAALEARIDAKLRQACTVEAAGRYSSGRTSVDSKCVAEARTVALAEVERVAMMQQARSGRTVAAN
jgi:UrcA family protein